MMWSFNKDDEVDHTYSMHGRDEKCMYNFSGKPGRQKIF
jgi:hypothetical protein